MRHRFSVGKLLPLGALAFSASAGAQNPDALRQLEDQYRITCSPQTIANSPFMREQCRQLRAQIDAIGRNRASGPADTELDDDTAPTPPAYSGGAIGDPAALSPRRVYEDQCRKKTPRTDAERAQCERLRQTLDGGRAAGGSAPAPGGQANDRSARPGGNPVDHSGADCVAHVDTQTRRWGSAGENTDISYHFRNGCTAPMFVDAVLARNSGPDQGSGVMLCPGETKGITCSSFAGRGCTEVASYRFKHYPEGAESCRKR